MKLKTSTIWQAITYIAAVGPQVVSLPISPSAKNWISGAAAICGVLLHVHAGQHDTDGTPLPAK